MSILGTRLANPVHILRTVTLLHSCQFLIIVDTDHARYNYDSSKLAFCVSFNKKFEILKHNVNLSIRNVM